MIVIKSFIHGDYIETILIIIQFLYEKGRPILLIRDHWNDGMRKLIYSSLINEPADVVFL